MHGRAALLLLVLLGGSPALAAGERVVEVAEGKDGGIETADGKPLLGESFVFDQEAGYSGLASMRRHIPCRRESPRLGRRGTT